MLIGPTSAVVKHQIRRCTTPDQDGPTWPHLARVRHSTTALFPELLAKSGPAADHVRLGAHCRHCAGLGVRVCGPAQLEHAVRELRPAAASQIDQCHVDAPSLARRLAMLDMARPLPDARVAFVGDDDLASVGLLHSLAPSFVLVVDIDDRVLNAVTSEARRLGLEGRVGAAHTDLSVEADVQRLLDGHAATFDLVVTDPPYAEAGMLTFLQVALALTAYGGEAHVALPSLIAEAWTDELMYAVQRTVLDSGFVIDRVHPATFVYEGSDVVSSLLVARRLSGSVVGQPWTSHSSHKFYTTRIEPGSQASAAVDQEELPAW